MGRESISSSLPGTKGTSEVKGVVQGAMEYELWCLCQASFSPVKKSAMSPELSEHLQTNWNIPFMMFWSQALGTTVPEAWGHEPGLWRSWTALTWAAALTLCSTLVLRLTWVALERVTLKLLLHDAVSNVRDLDFQFCSNSCSWQPSHLTSLNPCCLVLKSESLNWYTQIDRLYLVLSHTGCLFFFLSFDLCEHSFVLIPRSLSCRT